MSNIIDYLFSVAAIVFILFFIGLVITVAALGIYAVINTLKESRNDGIH